MVAYEKRAVVISLGEEFNINNHWAGGWSSPVGNW